MPNQRQPSWRQLARIAPWEVWIYVVITVGCAIVLPIRRVSHWAENEYAIQVGIGIAVTLLLQIVLAWFLVRGSQIAWWIAVLISASTLVVVLVQRDTWWAGWMIVSVAQLVSLYHVNVRRWVMLDSDSRARSQRKPPRIRGAFSSIRS